MHRFCVYLIMLACLACTAHAQTYDWTIENTESVFGKDPDTPQTKRSSTTHLNLTINDKSQGQIKVTINTIDVFVPDTPIGDMSFDSRDPEDAANPLELVMRPLVGLTFTLTYELHDHQLVPSDNLLKQRGTSVLGQSFNPPYITPVFAPFMIFQGEADDDAPRLFMMIPYANGIKLADPSLIDYSTTKSKNGELKTTADLKATIEDAQLPGISSPASLFIEGNSVATHDYKSKELKSHSYELTSDLRFQYAPESPVRGVIHTKVTITRASPPPHTETP